MKAEEKLSENSREVVPTMTKYITASGKQVLTLLKSATAIIPVPMLQEATGVAVKIIEVFEDISSVEQKVKELQDRVCHLMIVIVDNVTGKTEEGGDEVILKTASCEGFRAEYQGLPQHSEDNPRGFGRN